ncbi:MAG: tetratricopeptide repeat protein [Dehalococcoidales bacterium]|nr:tetratricopeptide repeat protein [Dehalococcoidales bacterium]
MEQETVGLRQQQTKQAIALMMQGRWRAAVAVNQSLVEGFPTDVSAYNRLGRAYMELGEFAHAEEAYRQALEVDPYNTIARKNLDRLAHLKDTMTAPGGDSRLVPQHFIEETGKTGVVELDHLAPPEVVAKMVAGDRVCLKTEGAALIVENGRGEYLGRVDPRYGQRLARLIKGGNQYTAVVVSSTEAAMTIIIREVYQSPGQRGQRSFPVKGFKGYRPYISDRLIRQERRLEYEEEIVTDVDDEADNDE